MITQSEIQYTPYYGSTPLQYVYWGNALIWQKTETPTDPYEGYDTVLDWTTNVDPLEGKDLTTLPQAQREMRNMWVYCRINGNLVAYSRDETTISKNNFGTPSSLSFVKSYTSGSKNYWCSNPYLKRVLKLPFKENITDLTRTFYNCTSLTYINVEGWDLSKVTSASYTFDNATALTDIDGNFSGIKINISFGSCPLTNQSVTNVINGLEQVTIKRTITFSSTTYSTLTQEQIALATSKGWTVASA